MKDKKMAFRFIRNFAIAVIIMMICVFGSSVRVFAADDYPWKNESSSKLDPYGFYYRECVSFCAWRLNQNGIAFTWKYKGVTWGNAKTWGDAARSVGISVDMNPQVGDIGWKDAGVGGAGSYGHVCYITAVNGNQVSYEEYNYLSSHAYHTDSSDKSRFSGFIHFGLSFRTQVYPSAGYYKLQCADLGAARFLDVVGNQTGNGTNLQLCYSVTHGGQTFYVDRNAADTGYYFLHSTSGKFVTTESSSPGAHNAILWEGNGNDGQQWIFEDAGNGYVYVRNLYGYYLDVNNGNFEPGTNVQVIGFNGSDAQKWKLVRVSGIETKFIEDGYYKLQCGPEGDSKFLDVVGNQTENGINMALYGSVTYGGQTFYVGWNEITRGYYFGHKDSGKFLTTETFSTGEHNAFLWEGNGNDGQQWLFEDAGDGYVYVRNLFGYYLDVDNGIFEDGRNVQVWDYIGGSAQKWKLVKISGNETEFIDNGYYKLQSKGTECLNVEGNQTDNGTNISLTDTAGKASQVFNVGYNQITRGYYFGHKASGKFVTTETCTTGEHNVCLWAGNGNMGQQWLFEDAGEGYYYVRNLFGYYLEVTGGVFADGTNVRASTFTGSDAQKWKFVAATDPDLPDAPEKVTTRSDTSGITVTWSKVTDAKKYALYRRAFDGSSWDSWKALSTGLRGTSYKDVDIKASTKYQYKMRTCSDKGWGGFGTVVSAVSVPDAPLIRGTTVAEDKITIAWTASPGATKYAVYRKEGSGSWQTMIKTSSTSYADKTVSTGKKYVYYVKAYNEGGWSASSAYIRPVTVPAAPETVTAKAYTAKISISWSKVDGATKYALYRRTYSGSAWGSWEKIDTSLTVTSYADTTVKSGKKYQYKVMAYNEVGWGKTTASNSVIAK